MPEGEARDPTKRRNPRKVAVNDTHPGQETPHLKANLGEVLGEASPFFLVLVLI